MDSPAISGKAKYRIPLFFALIAAGLAGNHFNFPIFHDINFIFGSIFALLALQFFGLGRGIFAGAIIAGYTYLLWNQPYSMIIMTAEVAVVGWLMGRRKMGMVLADALFWLFIGMPLVYLFFHFVIQPPFSDTSMIMTKTAVNGIFNALAARLIFTAFALRLRPPRIAYSEIICNLLTFFVLCPALIMLTVDSRADLSETDRHFRASLIEDSEIITQHLKTWVENRKTAIITLAEMAASRSPQQMQPYLELTKKSDDNFLRVALLNKQATITAIFPLSDELGQNNIGVNFADCPHNQTFQQTLQPMLSEVVLSRIGITKPHVSILIPVVIQGEYAGRVTAFLGLKQIQEYLDRSVDDHISHYTLLDKNGNVIMSNRSDLQIMSPFIRENGTLHRRDNSGINLWMPNVPPYTPYFERWKDSFYFTEATIGDLAEWKLILEQPIAPFQKMLYDKYAGKFTLLFLILLGALALAELLGRRTVVTLKQLRALTHELPARLESGGKNITWPESGIKENQHLIKNFNTMANLLSDKFSEIRKITESLEQRVEERTEKLATANKMLTIEIAERKRIAKELVESTAAAEAASIAKSQFLANMSHEIRTPMNGVIGLIELLLRTELSKEQREYAELIKLSGRNLVQLISDILDLSKIEAHKIDLEIRNFNLQTETTGTINLLKLNARTKGLKLSAQIDEDVPLLLQGDAGRLRQILTNLIGNAIKFTGQGFVSLHIHKDTEDEQTATLRFLVRDSGIGIAADKLEKIFEPFTQADSSATRQYGGTGLGLAIVRQLAELMGGTVGVESEAGEGATFWFTVVLTKQNNLPLLLAPPPLPEAEGAKQRGAGEVNDIDARILLVEDDPVNRFMTKKLLTRSGYDVEVASNGREAINALEKNDYSLVIMDCMMPVLNGYETTIVIRNPASAVRNHAIPVIALTANAMQEDRKRCLAAGMDDYLAKPIEVTKMIAMLEKWLPLSTVSGTETGKADVHGE
jgi:signal transduction histidine kinase/ActR/RegA family two-component response regulator